jgi:periplasmic divalent cation tolerance protein
MVPQAVSTYRWKGKVEETAEVLLIIKTSKAKAKLLEEVVRKSHPSELPEFVSFSAEGSAEYLAWIESETR